MDNYRARWERDVRTWSAVIEAAAPARPATTPRAASSRSIVLTQLCISQRFESGGD